MKAKIESAVVPTDKKSSRLWIWILVVGVVLCFLVRNKTATTPIIFHPQQWGDSLKVQYHKGDDGEWFDIKLSESIPLRYFEIPDSLGWRSWEKYFLNPQPKDYVQFWFYGSEFPTPAYQWWKVPEFRYHGSRARVWGHGVIRYMKTG